jgi:hypothetical protein
MGTLIIRGLRGITHTEGAYLRTFVDCGCQAQRENDETFQYFDRV